MLESGQLAIAVTTLELKHIISGNGFKLGFNVTGSCHVSQESVEAKRKLNRGMTNQIQRWHVVSTESMSSWLTASNRRLAYIRIYMLLLELGQLTLDETCNISEPSGFLTAALPISLSSPLPIENRTSVSKTSVKSSRKYFVHLNWVILATNPSWFDSSIGRAVV